MSFYRLINIAMTEFFFYGFSCHFTIYVVIPESVAYCNKTINAEVIFKVLLQHQVNWGASSR